MKKQLALSTLVCGLLLGATHLQAQTPATPSDSVAKKEAKALANPAIMQKDHAAAAKVEESIAKRNFEAKMKRSVFEKEAQTDKKKLIQAVINKRIKDHKPAPKEIIIGMQDTFNALQAMGKGKKDEAQKDLEAAIQSFDAALKADPALDLVPVDERFQAFEFLGSSDVIAAQIKLAEQLLKEHDIQAAIDTIAPLKDELDITTITIPMKLYPQADKKALDALKKGQEQAALDAIATDGTFSSPEFDTNSHEKPSASEDSPEARKLLYNPLGDLNAYINNYILAESSYKVDANDNTTHKATQVTKILAKNDRLKEIIREKITYFERENDRNSENFSGQRNILNLQMFNQYLDLFREKLKFLRKDIFPDFLRKPQHSS